MSLREILAEISDISKEIGASKIYICGGTPRDKYMNNLKNVSDIDLTTGDETIHHIAKEVSIRMADRYHLFKKMDDGHSKMILNGISFDFSSNFITPGIDGFLKQIGINNPTKLQKEMFSRDFTCNAMLLDLDLVTIIDPTGMGKKDISRKILKTCLNPSVTLGSDNKRIIRSIYLSAKLSFDLDDSVKDWIKKNPKLILSPGPNYVLKKLREAMSYNKEKVFQIFDELGLWKVIPMTDSLIEKLTEEVAK